jgi:hypothetical protein
MKTCNFLVFLKLPVIICISFLFDISVFAQLQNWRYEVPITVNNSSGVHLVNYQALLVINTRAYINAAYMQTDGRDIRFASNCGSGLIDYCLENYINTDSTRIWIKIPSMAPNTSMVIYLYMGNPSAVSTSTLSIFDGPHSSTDQVILQNTSTVPHSQRGFRFSPERDIFVTHFGKRVPNGSPRYVTLFDFLTHQIIRQVHVSGHSGSYNYNLLESPIWLKDGRKYILEVYQGSGDNYYFGVSSQVGPYLHYYDMRYCNNCDKNTFPTSSYPNLMYGVPDFIYYIRQVPVNPEPDFNAGLVADTNTPAPPQGLYAIAGYQQALLKWRRNSEFDMSQYLVFKNTVNNPYTSTQVGSTNHPDTSFMVTGLNNGTSYYFWTKAKDRYCSPRISGFSNVAVITPLNVQTNEQIPETFELYQNQPNPFNPVTNIKYDIPRESYVKLVVYDLLGQVVTTLVNEVKKPGAYTVQWGSENMPSGVYIYRLNAGDFEKTIKMVLLK